VRLGRESDSGAPAPTPSVVVTSDVAYESANPVLTPGVLDVYAPAKAGPWPVVVMLHGPGWWDELREHARKVSDLGFVVFVPIWGRGSDDPPTYEQIAAIDSQASCAVAFARAHAADYGGDPATMIVFGHSGGAMVGAMVAFARPEPTAGCLGGTTPARSMPWSPGKAIGSCPGPTPGGTALLPPTPEFCTSSRHGVTSPSTRTSRS
jgi:acetyl esterase/lipase